MRLVFEAVQESGAGARPEGSHTVATSTPVRISASLSEAPGQPSCVPTRRRRCLVSGEVEELEAEEYEQIVERVAAIDAAKGSGQVCTRVPHASIAGRRVTKVWNVQATTNAISALAEQLACEGIERGVVESTSDYWRPFVYLLQARGLTVWLVNAREVKQVPGRPKTDTLDTVWLAKLNERGARPHRHAGGTPDGRLTGRNLTDLF